MKHKFVKCHCQSLSFSENKNMSPVVKLLVLLCLLFCCAIKGKEEKIETVEVDINGKTKKSKNKLKKEEISVVFENQSGKKVEVWSDTKETVFFKASLENEEKITIDTFIGEKMYFTPTNSGGSHEKQYYQTKIKKSDENEPIILYEKQKMDEYLKQRDAGCKGNRCDIIFINKYNKILKMYWDDGKDGVFQGDLSVGHEMTMHTHIGHKFFATSYKDKKRLFSHTVDKNSRIVELK